MSLRSGEITPGQAFAQEFLAEFFTDEVLANDEPAPVTGDEEDGSVGDAGDAEQISDESQAGEAPDSDEQAPDPFAGNGEEYDPEVGGGPPTLVEGITPPAPELPDYQWRITPDGRRTATVESADGQTLHLVQGDDQLSVLDGEGNIIAITGRGTPVVSGPGQLGAPSVWHGPGGSGGVYASPDDLLRALLNGGRAVLDWAARRGVSIAIGSVGVGLLTYSSATGGHHALTGENIRFEFDESFNGTLYQRGADGQWEPVRSNIHMDQLTDEEYARLVPPPGQGPDQPVEAPAPTPFPDQMVASARDRTCRST